MSYITIALPFNVGGEVAGRILSTAWLFKAATHRVLHLAKSSPALPGSDIGWKAAFRKDAYAVIPNRRYADGAVVLVRGIYESCRELGVDFRGVELGDWLMFQQAEKEYPARNITLRPGGEVYVTTISYSGAVERVVLKPTVPKSYATLLEKILEERQEHAARVVIKGYGVRKGVVWISGEVQLTIPLTFYYRHMARYRANKGSLYGGVDVNVDRVNLAIIDNSGELRDTYTFWFREVVARGYPRRSARSVIGMRVHEMLEYAYHHGVKVLFLENPAVLGRLRLLWARSTERRSENYNWKVSTFRSSIIEMIALKAPLYGIEVAYVNPKGTSNSREHSEAMKKLRLDRHATSAYLIALRGVAKQSKRAQ